MPRHAAVEDGDAVPYVLLEKVVRSQSPRLVIPGIDGEASHNGEETSTRIRFVIVRCEKDTNPAIAKRLSTVKGFFDFHSRQVARKSHRTPFAGRMMHVKAASRIGSHKVCLFLLFQPLSCSTGVHVHCLQQYRLAAMQGFRL